MTYPIPVHLRRPIFLASLLLTVIVAWVMAAPLTTPHARFGIVSLELAHSPAVAERVIASWTAEQQAQALAGTKWDFLWLLSYSTSISLACVWAADILHRSPFLSRIGMFLAWLLWLAALLDAVENVALLQMLNGAVQTPWPQISYWCALVKFDIVVLGLVYVLTGGASWLLGKAKGRMN